MTVAEVPSLLRPAEGPAPEAEIVRDIIKRALPITPVFVVVAALFAGVNGAASVFVGVVVVALNFTLAAASLAWAARINLALLMGVALGGYLVRVSLLFLAVLFFRDLAWVHLPSFGITLVVTHLGLLAWELQYVSASLAHPGLKPGRPSRRPKEPTR